MSAPPSSLGGPAPDTQPGYPVGMAPQPGYPGGMPPQLGYSESSSQQQLVVIVNQPQGQTKQAPRPWRAGLCGCFDDCTICLCVTFCNECAAHMILHDMGESPCLPCCMPNFLVPLRTKLRMQLNIQGSICNDCMVSTYCYPCAMCQLMIEHKLARQAGEL